MTYYADMTDVLSPKEARAFLLRYHFAAQNVPGTFTHLGSIQYDPLNPVGRNPDLVLGARVPGYQVDDWQEHAYGQRRAYDTWDKQHCLVPIADWPLRAPARRYYRPWHNHSVLDEHPEAVRLALAELDARGPLSSLDFTDRSRLDTPHSWLGSSRVKNILRALWARGDLVIHHREAGRIYYDRPERVIPQEYFNAPQPNLDTYHRWVTLRRHQATGLLRLSSDASVWSGTGMAADRRRVVHDLLESGDLISVQVGDSHAKYAVPRSATPFLTGTDPLAKMYFLAPLDNLLWDRTMVRDVFGFDYVWEVYKREEKRLWGYYVLPVLYRDRFVGRIEARRRGDAWWVQRWWWEEGVVPDAEMLEALATRASAFHHYLQARSVLVERGVDRRAAAAIRSGTRAA